MADDLHAPPASERINLRPWLLTLCFIWGIFCGFFIHSRRPLENSELRRPAPRQPEPDTGQSADSVSRVEPLSNKSEKRRDDPDIPPPSLGENKSQGELRRLLTEAIAEPLPLGLDTRIGLSGATARPPFPPAAEPKKSPQPSRQPPVLLPPEIR